MMKQRAQCGVARWWLLRLAVFLVLAMPYLATAGTYFNTPFYFQGYDAKQNLVRYNYDKFDDAVDNAKKYLVSSYPASNPAVCLPQSAYEDDALRIASGYIAKVSYASTDPKVSCPTNVLNIQLTQYNNDPEKNTGDAGNCDGGIGVSGGDGVVTCAGTTFIGDPINVAAGNKYVQETDVEVSPWLTFRRFYNSQSGIVRQTTLGSQWRHSFDRALSFLNTMPNGKGTSYILVQRPDGRSERFRAGTNGSWVTDPNMADTLTSDSTGYTLFVAGPNQFERYSTAGQLQYVMDQSGQSATLAYNGAQLQSVTDPQGRTLRFTYDGNGFLRTLTVPDGGVLTFPASITSSYLYDENSQLLGEYGDTMRDYLWLDGIPVAVSDTKLRGGLSLSFQTTTSYVHADGLNTPRAITDASGKVQWQWSYTGNPFGEQLPTSSTGFVYNLRYAGQYYDAESRLMDNIHRTYEPATGRYLQSDPIGLAGGWSTYAYVGGNSLNAADPLGLWVYTGNPTQCALFSGGLRMARDAATSPDLDAAQQATLAGAVNAYGREGDSSVRIVFNQENNFTGAVTGLRKNGVRFTSIV
ncbi:RHS repeat-associated core domain-containing protein [Dyella japonica]|uniref:RHS repeat-associated protein n=1 Tax=Dyella japonica TaxID=231455 RepID=A0ABV2JXH3_9GAMM